MLVESIGTREYHRRICFRLRYDFVSVWNVSTNPCRSILVDVHHDVQYFESIKQSVMQFGCTLRCLKEYSKWYHVVHMLQIFGTGCLVLMKSCRMSACVKSHSNGCILALTSSTVTRWTNQSVQVNLSFHVRSWLSPFCNAFQKGGQDQPRSVKRGSQPVKERLGPTNSRFRQHGDGRSCSLQTGSSRFDICSTGSLIKISAAVHALWRITKEMVLLLNTNYTRITFIMTLIRLNI